MTSLAARWASRFYETLGEERAVADVLREASQQSDLARWTAALTGVVVRSFEHLGLTAAGKGFRCTALPVRRNEYLAQDVMAFPAGNNSWRFPTAVCELENAVDPRLVAYSLWKVLCVRCALRVVFCYRADPGAGSPFVASLASSVLGAMTVAERSSLPGDTLVVVGSRNESETFPYGFFQAWKLNTNTGHFERFARR